MINKNGIVQEDPRCARAPPSPASLGPWRRAAIGDACCGVGLPVRLAGWGCRRARWFYRQPLPAACRPRPAPCQPPSTSHTASCRCITAPCRVAFPFPPCRSETSWPWMIELQALVPGLEGQTNYPEKPQDVMARGVSAPVQMLGGAECLAARRHGGPCCCCSQAARCTRPLLRLELGRPAPPLRSLFRQRAPNLGSACLRPNPRRSSPS